MFFHITCNEIFFYLNFILMTRRFHGSTDGPFVYAVIKLFTCQVVYFPHTTVTIHELSNISNINNPVK